VASTSADHAPSAEETEPFETDESAAIPPPHPAYRMTARISILAPLPSASHREDRPKVTLPPQKRLGITLGPRYEVGESSSAAARPAGGLRADYGFVATMDKKIMRDPQREGQMSEIRKLQAADRKRQTVILELLRIDHRRSTKITELRTTLQGQGLAGGPTQSELLEEAGSDS
nr:hypothetical protein [Tanacetum cinerariifolium]